MVKMKVADSQLLIKAMSAISTVADETTFQIDSFGIKLRVMDPSRVAMVDFSWPKTAFEEFVCDAPTKLCVNIRELLKLLRRASKDDKLELSTITDNKLQVAVMGKNMRNFTMPILEPSEEDVPTLKIAFNVKAKATVEGLRSAIEDAQLVSDHVKIRAEADKLLFIAKGDLMSADITLQKESNSTTLMELETKDPPQRATFSLSYLVDVLKAGAGLADLVSIEFSSDMPIKLDFLQSQQEAKLTYYLAPRIEADEAYEA